MGCCYSYEEEDDDNARRAQPVYVIARPTYTRSNHDPHRNHFEPKPGALYGQYKCRCGNFWVSRLSWRDRYQECKRCHAQVRPRNQRELRPSDFTRGDDNVERSEHPQHLCEMCKRVGGYCGRYK